MLKIDSIRTETRLPSNLRPTTRKCVHVVTCVHFRSRDKDGGHTIRSAISENSMLHANFTTLCFIEREVIADRSFIHCLNRYFRPFLLLWPWPWPWPADLHIRTRPVFPQDTTDVQKSRKLTSDKQTYRQTDTTEIIYHAASRVFNKSKSHRINVCSCHFKREHQLRRVVSEILREYT